MLIDTVITKARWCDCITLVLCQLHCLPVWWRVNYKITRFVRQSLSGLMTSQCRPPTVHVSFHVYTIPLATAVCCCSLQVWHNLSCDRTSVTDNSDDNWKHFCLGLADQGPRRLVTVYLRLRNILTYLQKPCIYYRLSHSAPCVCN